MSKQLIVIGGGAAGFFCAVNAARLNPQLNVIILEKTGKLLSKVKVSGGGRCNVAHACFDIAEMSKQYPRGYNFVKKTFHQFFTADTMNWFEERGVALKTEADGRIFPVTDTSQTIIDCLMREANRFKVEIRMKSEVARLESEVDALKIILTDGRQFRANFVCVACGGYAKSSMFEWLRQTGHTIQDPVPSLFTFNIPNHPITRLMGLSVESACVKVARSKLEGKGPMMITHWGFSGPAILRLSAWGARQLAADNWQFSIVINWTPAFSEQSLQERFLQSRFDLATSKIINRNPFGLPQRFWEYLLEQSGIISESRWADLKAREQYVLIRNLNASEFVVKGKTTYKEEFVTAGGINLQEVDVSTMMSKIVPQLYFAGEILDVDGITGGFNFQHAWTSGFIAAKNISLSSLQAT